MAGKRRRRGAEPIPGWIWMLGGFSLGLIVALGLYLWQRIPAPGLTGTASTARATLPAQPAVVDPVPVADLPGPTGTPDANGTFEQSDDERRPAADDTSASVTEFEFYEVLPEFEVVVPDTGEALRPDTREAAAARAGNYVVQAGSFLTQEDAERMKARIALLGFESRIQRVAIDDDVYHRIRIGPVTDLGELNRIRRRLREERIDYLLIDTPD